MAQEALAALTTILKTGVRRWPPALKIAVIYALFAGLWIIFSDHAIDLIAISKSMVSVLQTWKGLVFVFITAVLVYLLVQYYFQRERRLFEQLRKSKSQLGLILDTVPNGILENDLDGRITYTNPGYQKILGYPPESLIGRYIWDFQLDENEKNQLQNYFYGLLTRQPKPETYVSRSLTHDGEEKVLEICWDYQRDTEGTLTGFISVISDITQAQRQEQEIFHLAYYDPLTELPNRLRSLKSLTGLIDKAQQKNEQVAVIILDLDHFKKINDSLGHDTGDRLLQEIVVRLKACLSEANTIGRLGGDEFIILHHQSSQGNNLPSLIDALMTLFTTPFVVEHREMMLSASIGVAVYPHDGNDATELLRNADSAMFYAKDSGRNSYSFFTRTMDQEVTRRFAIEEQLNSALEKGQLSLVYQPQVALLDNSIIGAEALIRWHNPTLGDVSPDEFIPIAEQSRLILPIGRFVLEEAIKLLATIQTFQPLFRLAINLSPAQFRDFSLITHIRTLLQQYEVQASQIELEITEGILLSGSPFVGQTLEELSDMGVKLVMDDFGTGYSSLNYLRNYPFKVLKIDRCFMSDIMTSPDDREMITAVVAMSQGLDLKVVAEGVETDEQRAFLQTIGCDYAQGFYFSKPLKEAQLLGFLR